MLLYDLILKMCVEVLVCYIVGIREGRSILHMLCLFCTLVCDMCMNIVNALQLFDLMIAISQLV